MSTKLNGFVWGFNKAVKVSKCWSKITPAIGGHCNSLTEQPYSPCYGWDVVVVAVDRVVRSRVAG